MRLNRLIIITLTLLVSSCIEPFIPETAKYENSIFIEALVTNDPDLPTRVRIANNLPIRTREDDDIDIKSPVDGAEVFILCDDGSEYQLANNSPGLYESTDPSFIGEPGKSYKIIIYYDGETYESDFEMLNISPEIDSISYKVDEQKLSEAGISTKGYTFQVSTHSDSPEPTYYRWIAEATYYYIVPFDADYIKTNFGRQPYDNSDVKACWNTKNIAGIFVSGTEGLTENAIVEAPLHFESQYGDELTLRYRLHVRQLAITQECYYFWKDLDKLINQTGGLYETQPFRLQGNIRCLTNNNSNVTGIFEVAGVSGSVKYFRRPDEFPVSGYFCGKVEVGTEDYPWMAVDSGTILIYDSKDNRWYTSDAMCFDCTLRGGTTERPSFWEF